MEIKRTPIIIQRVPITIQRIPWDEVYDKFIKLIYFAARQVFNQYHTEPIEDLEQEGQLILYRCWLLYGDRSWEDFTPAFKASLWRKLREVSRKLRPTPDLETMTEYGDEPNIEIDFDTMLEDNIKLRKIYNMIGDYPLVKTIFQEFMSPSEETVWEGKMDWARKHMLMSLGHNVIVPKSVLITKKAIKRMLNKKGVLCSEIDKAISKLQAILADVYGIRKY